MIHAIKTKPFQCVSQSGSAQCIRPHEASFFMGSILNRYPKQMDGWRGDILWRWHFLMAPLIGLLVFWEDLTALADQRVEAIFYKNRQNSCKSTWYFMQNVN